MNPELEEQLELERLIAEQEEDDVPVVYGEKGHEHDVSLDDRDAHAFSVTDTYFEGTKDEHSSYDDAVRPERERGTVLVGSATWHGTITGYKKHGCKCIRCTAALREYMRSYRARKKQEKAS